MYVYIGITWCGFEGPIFLLGYLTDVTYGAQPPMSSDATTHSYLSFISEWRNLVSLSLHAVPSGRYQYHGSLIRSYIPSGGGL
jgi:hypothetical protein